MAFPASNGAVPLTLEAAWKAARDVAAQVKAAAASLNSQISAGPVSAQNIVNFANFLAGTNANFATYAAVPGIGPYAQNQVNNATLDVAAAFTAMQSAISTTAAWIATNFPKDASGNLLCVQLSANGTLTWTQFTTAQLAGLATQLTALLATIS